MYDIVIIGAGPAGLSAAIYGARAGKNVLMLESNMYGGQIINSSLVDNYPGVGKTDGYNFAKELYNQAISVGAKIKYEKVISITEHQVNTVKASYQAKTIIIATGVKKRSLGLPNEKELIGKGISYCATCDGNFYKGKSVAVVGGGNTALEEALYLSDIADKVYLIHRRDEYRGEDLMIKQVMDNKNIVKINNVTVTKINGTTKIESIDLSDGTNLDIACLFIAIGQEPDNAFAKYHVNINKLGFIDSEDCTTKTDYVFVAGDCRSKELRQLVTATSDGAIAADKAIKYINSHNL